MQAARHANFQKRLNLTGEEQVTLCRPVLNIIERVCAREWASINKGAAIGNPVQYRRIVVVLHGVTGIGEGDEAHPGLNRARELSSMTTKEITHRCECLVNNFLGHLFTGEPSCKCGHWTFLFAFLCLLLFFRLPTQTFLFATFLL